MGCICAAEELQLCLFSGAKGLGQVAMAGELGPT